MIGINSNFIKLALKLNSFGRSGGIEFFRKLSKMPGKCSLAEIIQKLNEFAPLNLAEAWDNVGLLIEPATQRSIGKILLTNDLTEHVMKEAIDMKVDMIISYHPPIFSPLKKITQSNWKERILSQCLENRIAVYSPHTAWDSIINGVNDWLAMSLLPNQDTLQAISPYSLDKPAIGAGRFFTTSSVKDLNSVIEAVKIHLNLDHIQVSLGCNRSLESKVNTVALCAGSGGSLLKNITADVFITGEMSHHELLDAAHRNISVIVCNHSNTERGYLKHFRKSFLKTFDGNNHPEIIISKLDFDPLLAF